MMAVLNIFRKLRSLVLILIALCTIFVLKYEWRSSESPKAPLTAEEKNQMVGILDTDEKLVQFTKSRVLIEPNSRSVPYNLEVDNWKDYSVNQVASTIYSLLGEMKNGFFVECGVWDGEKQSNSLMLEKYYNWTGLLVEGSPTESKKILTKNRKAWVAPVCMSTNNTAIIVSFLDNKFAGRIYGPQGMKKSDVVTQLCIPFNTLMLALNLTTVDYFSLDVEGDELEILSTIDFERFHIRTMTVEHTQSTNKLDDIIKLMARKGFKLNSINNLDFIFVNEKNNTMI
ncbi:Hypothetical predicted protein [Cloeon dipterum]|uniref:Methyltransferase FkbM domain-containing protein n=1 Tax=Cloeon dipterum TaxID=197152 RepID=A0A8S1DVB0_9INSE|nr:Hypothetical predicted protein [Cloeon dipterum]